jgi:hypothetical protein
LVRGIWIDFDPDANNFVYTIDRNQSMQIKLDVKNIYNITICSFINSVMKETMAI